MESDRFDKESIGDPRLWRLYLRLGEKRLDAMLYNVATDNTLIHRVFPLDNPDGRLKALEDVIYDNPILLGDFQSVDIIVESMTFTIIPAEITDPGLQRAIFDSQLPGNLDCEMILSHIGEQNAVIAAGIDSETARFLRRTFNNPPLHHHLAPLCHYFYDKSRIGNAGKMYAHLREGYLDLLLFGRDTLRLANTYATRDTMDAVYYIIAARQQLGLNPDSDELLLAGDHNLREAVTPVLREYLAYVMPAIFPSTMYRAGKEALKAPFDLIVMPLCV